MGDTTYIVLGNGFSIGLIELLNKSDIIDLKNLFSKGDEVPWPDSKERGFLSRKYCKNLWTLGARSTMTNSESNKFINDIITCLNVYNFAKLNNASPTYDNKNIYIEAHNELSTYLKNLFIYYNSLVSNTDLINVLPQISLLKYIETLYSVVGKNTVIVTYNYDIFLERILKLKKIPFSIQGFDKRKTNIKMIKPHGSVSFVSKNKTLGKSFEIKNTFDSVTMDIKQLELDYELKMDDSFVNAIIPPAGDSNRLNNGWVRDIRGILKEELSKSKPQDNLIIYGLSYDHVDRMELDEIVTTVNSEISVKYVNPYPSATLDAVLSSIFKNYVHIKRPESLLEV